MIFNWPTAAAIFAGYCALDALDTIYLVAVSERRKLRAANVGFAMYVLSAYGVINYVGGAPHSVITADLDGDRISAFRIIVNPEKLRRVPPLED